MEYLKNFFNGENIKALFENFYSLFENLLQKTFGSLPYEPIRSLLSNPWFWIILVLLLLVGIIFRKR